MNNTITVPPIPPLPTPNWFNYFSLITSLILITTCLVGLVGNGLSIAIFVQSQFRSVSINILLLALSISDFCLLSLSAPVFTPAPLISYFGMVREIIDVYTFGICHLYPITSMFNFCSIWLLVAVTVERWVAVCRPLKVASYCTRKRAIIVVTLVVIISVLYNVVRFWEFQLSKDRFMPIKKLRANEDYMLIYSTIGKIITIYVIPLSLMIYFNSCIGLAIAKCQKERIKMNAAQRAENRTTRMLLFVVLSFILCYSLSLFLNIFEAAKPGFFTLKLGYSLSYINNILVTSKAATNFLFYLKFSSRYRLSFKLLFLRLFCPGKYKNFVDNQSARSKFTKSLNSVNYSDRTLLVQPRTALRRRSNTTDCLRTTLKTDENSIVPNVKIEKKVAVLTEKRKISWPAGYLIYRKFKVDKKKEVNGNDKGLMPQLIEVNHSESDSQEIIFV